jgi:hypothetical protein
MKKSPIIEINGVEHHLVVMKVTDHDAKGRPSAAVIGYDDTTFKLEGGEEFITAWVRVESTASKSGQEH